MTRLVIGTAGFGALIVACFLAITLASGGNRAPRISFNATTIDFGEHFEGEDVPCVFIFMNRGRATLHLTAVQASCRCLALRPSKTEIQPGERAKLVASYDTRGLSGPVQSALLVGTDDPKSPFVKLSIVGRVTHGYAWQPRVIDFGQTDAAPGTLKTVVLTKLTAKPIEIMDLHTSQAWLKAAVVSESPGPFIDACATTNSCIAVELGPGAPAGPFREEVVISILMESSTPEREIRIPVCGRIKANDSVSRPGIYGGNPLKGGGCL